MKLIKLLRHLTNTPVAIALAFLLVGTPAGPMAKTLPSSGDAMATCYTGGPVNYGYSMVPDRPVEVDSDCDGYPDARDNCPNEAGPYLGCPYSRTEQCHVDAEGWKDLGAATGATGVLRSSLG